MRRNIRGKGTGGKFETRNIRGMRIRVKDVLEMLAARVNETQILEDYPYLEAEDIQACLEFAATEADHAMLRTA
jgi:uncharacterized protein (DUF433 family)